MTPTPFTLPDLIQAWTDCRRNKRQTASAQAFEAHAEANLLALQAELLAGTYTPGRSTCFAVQRPKLREVWAAEFRDRIVHHLLHNHIAPRFEAAFVANSCACIKGRGTLYAAQRLEAAVRSVSHNWARPAWYLKCDLANFFVSIDRRVLRAQLARRLAHEPWWLALADTVLLHDPRPGVVLRGRPALLAQVPAHKSLFNAPATHGLPIGNLSSQFFANVLLDALDQFCKHQLRARHYVRYVDDFVLLHKSPQWLNAALARITAWLPEQLGVRINPAKTVLQPVGRGVDFAGQVCKPWRRTLRRRTVNHALRRLADAPATTPEQAEQLFAMGNSYLGLAGQATHGHADRARVARALRARGFVVAGDLTKVYRRKSYG